MTEYDIINLKSINDELKDVWKQNEKKINEIELNHPEFKEMYAKDSEYGQYISRQTIYSVVSLIQGILERHIDKIDKDAKY